MNIREIDKNIYYVGVNDRVTELFEAQWPLPYGVSYNSYIVRGSEATALIDTVKADEVREFFNNLSDIKGAEKIDYLVVNHMEPDHSGLIPEVIKAYPEIKIICNSVTVPMLKGFCYIEDDERFLVLKDGDSVSLGDLTLRIRTIPMVHWPETMVCYVEERKILFSGDAFGTFGALNGGVTDREMETDLYIEEMYRYYSNIVGKYGRFVTAALTKLAGVEISYICPTHGPVWIDRIPEVVEITRRLAAYESEPGVVIIYGSMYGNTAEAAEAIARELSALGERKIIIHSATHSSMSDMIRDAFRYKTLIVGSCTYSMRLLPAVEMFLTAMATREIRDKVFGVFGSFTWAPGVAGAEFKLFSETMKLPVNASLTFKHSMNKNTVADIKAFAAQIKAAQDAAE